MKTQTFSVHFLVRQDKRDKMQGLLYARITVNGQRAEFSLQSKVELALWNADKGKLKGRTKEATETNFYLDNVKGQLMGIYRELVLKKEFLTPDIIKSHFFGEQDEGYTLMRLVEFHRESQVNILSWGTLKNYHTTEKYLAKFLLEKKKTKDLYLHQLNYRFITEFEAYLRAYQPVDHHKPLANNGVMKHLERLRKMVNLSVKLEWLDKNPFEKYRLSFKKVERTCLIQEEVDTIEKKTFSIERLQYVKDLFVFACYTGLAYIDICKLTPNHVTKGIDGGDWIYSKREKTEVPVHIPLLPKARAILAAYKDNPRALHSGKLFPPISNQKLNSYLKEVADLCGIKKKLTFHIARHTFATTITLSNGVPIETVSKLLGHTMLSTTQIYAKVVENKVSDDMQQLQIKLSGKQKQKKAASR